MDLKKYRNKAEIKEHKKTSLIPYYRNNGEKEMERRLPHICYAFFADELNLPVYFFQVHYICCVFFVS